jgi:hypothetical protein
MSTEEKRTGPGFTMTDLPGGEPNSVKDGGETKSTGDTASIDFSTFVLSLGTSALYQLGQVADPESGTPRREPNRPLARQTIDTLEMLAEKTRGNLDSGEAKLLESILYELHMKFVETR